MSKAQKLVTQLLSGRADKNLSFADLCYLVERAGFTARAGKGSHHIYSKHGIAEIINVQPRAGGQAKPYQVKQVRELFVKYQINLA